MSDPTSEDTTRHRIIRAAAHHFARTPYTLVRFEDILTDADLTQAAVYFHFRSKQALALAVIDEFNAMSRAAVQELLGRELSGLETVIDASYLFAYQSMVSEIARSARHLVESIGHHDGLAAKLTDEWSRFYTRLLRRAAGEGDLIATQTPEVMGRLLAAMYSGVRRVSDAEKPDEFLANLRDAWLLVLPGFVPPERISYFTQFIQRRHALVLARTFREAPEPPASID